MESASPKKHPLFSKFTYVIVLPILLVVMVLLGVLCGPDQFQRSSVSEDPYEPALKAEAAKKIRELLVRPDVKESRAGLLEIARVAYPMPDTARWPAERQAQALKFQTEFCELLVERLLFPEKTRGLSYRDVGLQVKLLEDKETAIVIKYKDMRKQFPQKDRDAEIKQDNALWRATFTEIFIMRGMWVEAARSNIGDWDKATTYLRRGGIKGRIILAVWSIWRRIHPEGDFKF